MNKQCVPGTYILKTYVKEICESLREGGSVTVPAYEHVEAIKQMLDYGESILVVETDDGLEVRLRCFSTDLQSQ